MSFKKASLVAMLAVSMTSTSVLAQTATPASSAPVARSGADMDDASALNGGWFIPLLAALAVIAGLYFLIDDGGDRPVSP